MIALKGQHVNCFDQANAAALFPMQNHFELMYMRVQAWPMAVNVIVPVPDTFHPALATVITMSPVSSYMANTLTCPGEPAANVAVSGAAVEK
jgi:hypothetical protein